jgi:hypothetical protein
MAKKRLGAKDIERLENTSVASALMGAGHESMAVADCGGLSCIGISCYGAGATCNNATATTLECLGVTCNGAGATAVVATVATCGGGGGGGGGCGLHPTCIDCSGTSCAAGRATGPMN